MVRKTNDNITSENVSGVAPANAGRSVRQGARYAQVIEKIQSWMEEASGKLAAGDYFAAEELADQALHEAHERGLYELMTRILLPLQEARRQRRLMAIDADEVFIFGSEDDPVPQNLKVSAGCYVVVAPSVGVEARRIAEQGLEECVPVIAFGTEPLTQAGLLPVVVVGPVTIRTRVRPVSSRNQMDMAWCAGVFDALTQEALLTFDPGRAIHRQIEDLMMKLDTLPESELLHQKLAEVARQANHVQIAGADTWTEDDDRESTEEG